MRAATEAPTHRHLWGSETKLAAGGEPVSEYLEPLEIRMSLGDYMRFNERDTATTGMTTDNARTRARQSRPLVIRTVNPDGALHEDLAKTLVDASGTWTRPSHMGEDGLQPIGEEHVRDPIDYGIPDVRGGRGGRDHLAGSTSLFRWMPAPGRRSLCLSTLLAGSAVGARPTPEASAGRLSATTFWSDRSTPRPWSRARARRRGGRGGRRRRGRGRGT